MNRRIVVIKVCFIAFVTIGLSSYSAFPAAGNVLLPAHEHSLEELGHYGDSQYGSASLRTYSQKPMTPFHAFSDTGLRSYTGNGYDRSMLLFGGENKGNPITLRDVHKYSGYATLGAGVLTGVLKSYHTYHCRAAKGTTALAAVTVLSGLASYGFPALNRSTLSSRRVQHRVMGIAGMIGCATAVFLAENNGFSSHPGLGVAGAVLMTTSVVLVKW